MSVLVSQSATTVPRRTRRPSPPRDDKWRGPRPSPTRRCSFGVRPRAPQTPPPTQSPGPVAYTIPKGMTRHGSAISPSFSLRGKIEARDSGGKGGGRKGVGDDASPGPAAYYPRDVGAERRGGKGFSLGTRSKYDPFVKQPDPCSYTLPSSFDAALAPRRLPTFSARPRSMFDVRRDGPDPAQYEVTDASRYKKAAPRFSFGRRVPMTWGLAPPPSPSPSSVRRALTSSTPHNLINNVLNRRPSS